MGTTGTGLTDPRLGVLGRITCGLPLNGQINLGSSGLFRKNNAEICNNENGSCERCMELDVNRLGLPKKHLLNFQGRICTYSNTKNVIFCGTTHGVNTCH